jgi:hypothetical protein
MKYSPTEHYAQNAPDAHAIYSPNQSHNWTLCLFRKLPPDALAPTLLTAVPVVRGQHLPAKAYAGHVMVVTAFNS